MKKTRKMMAALLSAAMLSTMWGSGLPVHAEEVSLHAPVPRENCIEYVNPDMGWGDVCRVYNYTSGIYPALYYLFDYKFNYINIAVDPDSVSAVYTLCTEIGFDQVTVSDTDRIICYDYLNSDGAVSAHETDFVSKQAALTDMLKDASAAGCQLQSAIYNECRCSFTPTNGYYLDAFYVSGIPAGETDALLQIAAAYDADATVEETGDGCYTVNLEGFMEACNAETAIRAAYAGAAVEMNINLSEHYATLTTGKVDLLQAAGIPAPAGEPLHVPVPWEDGIEYVNPDMYSRVYYRESTSGTHVAVIESNNFNHVEFIVDPADVKAVATVCDALGFDHVYEYDGMVMCYDDLNSAGKRSSDENDFTSKLAELTEAVRIMWDNGYAIESAIYNECIACWSPAGGYYAGTMEVENIPAGEEENLRQIVAAYDGQAGITALADGNGYEIGISDFLTAIEAEKAIRAAYPDAIMKPYIISTMLASYLKTDDIDLLKAAGVSASDTFLGDINLDGTVDLRDAILLGKANAGSVTLNNIQQTNADVDKNSVVDADDAILLLRFLLHLEETLG